MLNKQLRDLPQNTEAMVNGLCFWLLESQSPPYYCLCILWPTVLLLVLLLVTMLRVGSSIWINLRPEGLESLASGKGRAWRWCICLGIERSLRFSVRVGLSASLTRFLPLSGQKWPRKMSTGKCYENRYISTNYFFFSETKYVAKMLWSNLNLTNLKEDFSLYSPPCSANLSRDSNFNMVRSTKE